jgi:trk system potassium uptake protein TrkH
MIYPEGMNNLLENIPFLVVTMILITLGGLGHIVLTELWQLPRLIRKTITKPHWISLHTRVVLIVTSIVMVVGTAGIWIFGAGPTHSVLHAVFQAVGGRTAGFNTVPVGLIPLPSILILIALMFIGGSPGSCAGGIKTTSLAIWIARIRSNLRGDSNVNIFGYTIAPDLVSRARILMALTLLWDCLGVFILVVLHPGERLETLIFEQVSAFGTVGLTMDFTPRLETLSRLWIMLTMFMGRLGPLSLILWVAPPAKTKIGRPVARVMVG